MTIHTKILDSSRQAQEIKRRRCMVGFVISRVLTSSNVFYCHFYEELKFIPCTASNVIALSPQAWRLTWTHVMSHWKWFYLLCVILFSWFQQCIKFSTSLEIESTYILNFHNISIFVVSHCILMILKFPSILYIVLWLWELVNSTPQCLQNLEGSHKFEKRVAQISHGHKQQCVEPLQRSYTLDIQRPLIILWYPKLLCEHLNKKKYLRWGGYEHMKEKEKYIEMVEVWSEN